MKNSLFGPKQLLIILTIALLILMTGLVFGIFYAQSVLTKQSVELSEKMIGKDMSQLTPESKTLIQSRLNMQKPVIEQLNLLYTTATTAEIVLNSNITKYSEKSGINAKIETNSFSDVVLGSSKAKSVNVIVDNYVKYDQLFRFTSYIEKTLPKMQIVSLSLKRDASSKPDEIRVSNFKIAVYYK